MKIILFLLLGFIYADCDEIDNQMDCLASDHCEWHADEGACEDGDHDHGDDDHECDDCMDYCVSYVMSNYGYTVEEGTAWCSTTPNSSFGCADVCADDHDHDDEEHCDEIANQDECEASDHCEWHADEGACEDGEHDHGHGDCDSENHLNVDGLILEYNGEEIYSQFQGAISGSLDLHVNEAKDLTVHFLDQNENEIEGQDSECYPLSFEITDAGVISIEYGDHEDDDHGDDDHGDDDHGDDDHGDDDHDHGDDDHDDEHDDHEEGHANSFELTGLSMGSTTFSILIMHDGHADFTSMPILVNVEEHNETCDPGDVNQDGLVNVVDVVIVVEYILDGLDATCSSDVNNDGVVNVTDIVNMVQMIFGAFSKSYLNDATEADIIITDTSINVQSDGYVGGIQMTLSHGYNFNIDLVDAFVAEYKTINNVTTLIVVSDNQPLEQIAAINGKFKVESAIVVNSVEEISNKIVGLKGVELEMVGPNPFNPSTKLSVQLENAGYVSVKIYNLKGQVVATLADSYMEANPSGYTFNWNASQFPSGVYLARAESSGSVSTQKLTLLK